MKFSIRLLILGLGLVNGMATSSADVIVDGQSILSADISAISIDPISGDVTVAAGGLYTVTKDGEPPPGPQVAINTLTASSNTILEGQSITISWTTTDAESCTPSGGGGGWSSEVISLPGGTSSSLTLATAGTYVFTLGCTNSTPTSTSRNVSVQVDSDDPPPPASDCPAEYVSPLAGTTGAWSSFWGQNWPAPAYSELVMGVRTAGFRALEFSTGVIVEDGAITTIPHTSTNGNRQAAISLCPGDFTEHLPESSGCYKSMYIGDNLKWNTMAGSKLGSCDLDPNTTYYLNITFTNGVDPSTDQCSETSSCRTIIRAWN